MLDPQALARQNPATRNSASRLQPPVLDDAWLRRLQQEIGKPVGVHVDINTLAANPRLLPLARDLGIPVFTYHLGADAEHARALREGVLVWESTWTLLRMGVKQPRGPEYVSQINDERPLAHQADFFAGAGIGRSYGRVSGDINPIHLSALTAKFLGFKKAIAHGMWTKARALATLMPREAVEQAEVIVEFKTPLFLPARASLWANRGEGESVFEVRNAKGDKPHLRGIVRY